MSEAAPAPKPRAAYAIRSPAKTPVTAVRWYRGGSMSRCELRPEDCAADHICPQLGARPRPNRRGWVADCPACGSRDKLSIQLGSRGQRIVWECHRGCEAALVKAAMLREGIAASCVAWTPRVPVVDAAPDDGLRVEIEKLLMEQLPPVEFMIRVAETIWQVDARVAAEQCGISRATYYRHRRAS